MATYWLSFRLQDDRTYNQRYENLTETVERLSTKWWVEASSFIVFASEAGIDKIASEIADVIYIDTDLVIVGMPEFKSARLIGHHEDDDIFELMPFIKKV
ncbi:MULTISPECIES: hypothetical protein [unclassified Mesorhizobium]|uniref:hypothetical protein n=1 Tax=unclassified Mesorhizobium TaxID=325217 RepID=UPI001129870E|nr:MULTISPECIES: hypothetical protein [unclassified Mesorhizobium]MCA0058387.1 hypothetical protein [Mesorhizobium sp. B261B1A]TPL04508.1 hypothetical protein FJ944_26080 [Mesorhizobium sp. B2-4-11]